MISNYFKTLFNNIILQHKRRKKPSLLTLLFFFKHFATLYGSGIPIDRCLILLKENQKNFMLNLCIDMIQTDILSGKKLYLSFKKFPEFFSPLLCQLIQLGEQSGQMDTMLVQVSSFLENSLKSQQKIKQALFYPGMVLGIALAITFGMLIWVVPKFSDLFEHANVHLPFVTQIIFSFSKLLRENFLYFVVIIFIIINFIFIIFDSNHIKNIFQKIMISTPILSTFYKKIILTRFIRNFSVTTASGMPILKGLQLLIQSEHDHYFKAILSHLCQKISAGIQIHQAMTLSAYFPPLFIQMIKIGEESGTFQMMLEKLADIFEAELDLWVDRLSDLLEPLIMILLGVLIGGLVISMYLPLFKLGSVI